MPFLGKTWGEMIYQEQMFEILRQLAGFTWARVDDAKTAMTKKDAEKMAALRDEAVAGFRKVGGLPAQAAEKLWAMIQAQAGYLFNRSHAVAYSFLTYQTARLKFEYPLEFCAALLATVEGDNKEEKIKREGYMAACLARGYRILPPDINESGRKFTPIKTRTLRFGLEDIKGVGEKAAERLLSARERASFASLADVAAAANNKAVLDALKESGALERFDVKTTSAKQEARLNWQFEDHMAIFRKKYAKKVKLPNGVRTEVRIIGELTRAETRRTRNGDPFMTWTVRWQPGQEFKINLWQDAEDVWNLQKGSVVMVEGKWSQQWNNMAIGDPDDVRILKKVLAQKKKKVAA
jgi:DNA polymerase-3 subunit alpha